MVDRVQRTSIGALAGRLALFLFALAVALWLAGNFRAQGIASDAAVLVGKARRTPQPQATLASGAREYVRARRFNSDTHLLVEEGAGLAVTGYRARAARLGLEATRHEPSNVDAWALVYTATQGRDRAVAARARREILRLDPRAGRH